jgi:hypothetical protein
MIGFRNTLVHEYIDIDRRVVSDILQNGLKDIEKLKQDLHGRQVFPGNKKTSFTAEARRAQKGSLFSCAVDQPSQRLRHGGEAGTGKMLSLQLLGMSFCQRAVLPPRRSGSPLKPFCGAPCGLRPHGCRLGLRGFVLSGSPVHSPTLRPTDSQPCSRWPCR